MEGWIDLIEAMIKRAKKDVRSKSSFIAEDAKMFLSSTWCEDLMLIINEWHRDQDRKLEARMV